jgi:hypothetical protein
LCSPWSLPSRPQGQFLDASLIAKFRTLSAPIVNYTIDDPFGGRDGRRFDNYLKAAPWFTSRGRPPRRAAGIRGAMSIHSESFISLG